MFSEGSTWIRAKFLSHTPCMEIRPTGKARAVVRKYLASRGVYVGEEGKETEDDVISFRPARLGLGAKYVPHVEESNAKVEQKIRSSLRRSLKNDEEDWEIGADEESRTAITGKRFVYGANPGITIVWHYI